MTDAWHTSDILAAVRADRCAALLRTAPTAPKDRRRSAAASLTSLFAPWKREFDGYVAGDNLPSLQVLTVMNDHFGDFSTNVGGLQSPTLELASNDHSIGLIVDAVSHSKYWKDTAIFIAEDDSQDGPDHVDSHRSIAWAISAYSKPGVIHTFYNHPAMVRTIEDILGANYLGINDANAFAMDDAFTTNPNYQPYDAIIPGVLCQPPVHQDLVPKCFIPGAKKTPAVPALHSGSWWMRNTKRMVFNAPDRNDPVAFNKLIWQGLVGDAPYPEARTGEDFSLDRENVLNTYRVPVALQ